MSRSKPLLIAAWRRMLLFEKISLVISLLLYLLLPLAEASAKDNYFSTVALNIFSALVEGLFLLGIIAFLQHVHTVSKDANNGS